jgi:hypothetical protein
MGHTLSPMSTLWKLTNPLETLHSHSVGPEYAPPNPTGHRLGLELVLDVPRSVLPGSDPIWLA